MVAKFCLRGDIVAGKERVDGVYISFDPKDARRNVHMCITTQPPPEGYVAIQTRGRDPITQVGERLAKSQGKELCPDCLEGPYRIY